MIETCFHRIGYRRVCQDSVGAFERGDGVVIIVADGAGGIEDGEIASRSVVDGIRLASGSSDVRLNWEQILRQMDFSMPSGQSTACVAEIHGGTVRGASVGDSRIGVVMDDQLVFPTDGQIRKPLLGSGHAQPRSFEMQWNGGLVIAGSDGFWNQMTPELILAQVHSIDFPVMAARLCELTRLPSGNLADDVGVVCARRRTVRRAQHRIDLTLDA